MFVQVQKRAILVCVLSLERFKSNFCATLHHATDAADRSKPVLNPEQCSGRTSAVLTTALQVPRFSHQQSVREMCSWRSLCSFSMVQISSFSSDTIYKKDILMSGSASEACRRSLTLTGASSDSRQKLWRRGEALTLSSQHGEKSFLSHLMHSIKPQYRLDELQESILAPYINTA